MQKVQMRTLHHDYSLAQGDKGISSTGQSNDAQPAAALPKYWTVNEQNRAAREREDRNEWQQNPEHPLSEPRVSHSRNFVIARRSHSGHNRCKNRVESLINFSEPVRGADDCTVNTNRCERHTGRASNKVAEHEEVQ